MQRLKHKRTYGAASHQDYWKNFTDVFATICLTFFFVMVVFGILSSYLGNRANALAADVERREMELFASQLALAENMALLTEQQRELVEAEAARLLAEAQLEDMEMAFRNMITLQLANMDAARADFDRIAIYRVNMYRRIEAMLQEVLGDQVYYDEDAGTLIIGTDILFDTGEHVLSPEQILIINQMRPVLFAIIDEYTQPGSLVRFDSFLILGHTDRRGTGHSERILSQRRARSIVNTILPVGSPEEARYGRYFIAAGASMFQPIAGTLLEQTDEEMAQNRRIEIIINFDDREIERAIAEIANTLLVPDVVPGVDMLENGEDSAEEPIFMPNIGNGE